MGVFFLLRYNETMPTSKLNVFNRALAALHQEPVIDVNSHTPELAKLRSAEEMTRQALLQSQRWDFATKRTELTYISDYTFGEYTKLFALPNDYLEVWRVYDIEGQDIDYAKISDGLICDASRVFVEYVFDETDYSKYDATFGEAFALALAERVSENVLYSDSKTDYIAKAAAKQQAIAASKAVGRSPRTWSQSTTWLNGRNNY